MENFVSELTMANIMAVGFLVVLEGILSFDNALALAAMVKSRLSDPKLQKRALTYGIWGAYIFRVAIVFCGVWLMQFWQVKAAAGAYLVWLGTTELIPKRKVDKKDLGNESFGLTTLLSPLWATVVSVEIMDLMFSIDSIGVALAVSNVKWVLITGAVMGILMMRFAASIFINLIDRYPILEKTAFLLVLIAGVGVGLKAFHIEIPEEPFIGLLLGVLGLSVMWNHWYPAAVKRLLSVYH